MQLWDKRFQVDKFNVLTDSKRWFSLSNFNFTNFIFNGCKILDSDYLTTPMSTQ